MAELPEGMELQRVYYHAERTQCMTYFRITGNFDPDDITKYLRLAPESVQHIGDVRSNGVPYDYATWRFGKGGSAAKNQADLRCKADADRRTARAV